MSCANLNADQVLRAIAEQPCDPTVCDEGQTVIEEMTHEACGGLGLANPWASELCPLLTQWPARHLAKRRSGLSCTRCNGSGRVPKAVGLEELVVLPGTSWSFEPRRDGYWCGLFHSVVDGEPLSHSAAGETPLLAALQAVAKSKGLHVPQGRPAA